MPGPGTIMKQLLANYGIKEKSGCACHHIAVEMDRLGKAKCQERFATLRQKIYDSIKDWRKAPKDVKEKSSLMEKIVELKQPPMIVIEELLQYCIDHAT